MAANLKNFRSKISRLKKQGVIPKSVDARSSYPGKLVNGKSLGSIAARYERIAKGTASTAKVSPSKLKAYRKAGFKTVKKRVIVTHSKGETVGVTPQGIIYKNHPSGIRRFSIPISYKNLREWMADPNRDLHKWLRSLEHNADKINDSISQQEYFGFKFFNNYSGLITHDIGELIEWFSRYDSVIAAHTHKAQDEIYGNFEIVVINRKSDWPI